MARIRRTYFEAISILGLNAGASPEEIKDTYRKLAKRYHPDVYKLDGGEKFKEISSAYRFLKKHPQPPQHEETQQAQFNDRQDEERRRRAYHRKQKQKKANEAARKAEMFNWLFARLRIFVYIIFIFNLLLLVDFFLPRVSEEVKIAQIITERSISRYGSGQSRSGQEFNYKAQLDNGMSFRFAKEEIAKIDIDETLILKRSVIFREGESLSTRESNVTVYNEFGVFKIFGFLIPIALILLIAYLFLVKNDEYRLTLFLISALIFLIQFVLVII